VTGTELPDWLRADATFFRQFGACFENRRCSGRAKARPHYMLPSEISSGHGLQPVRFFMHLGARIAHEILSPSFLRLSDIMHRLTIGDTEFLWADGMLAPPDAPRVFLS
jgi:hypothetical protein